MDLKYQGPNQPTAKDMFGKRVFPHDVVVIRRLADFMIGAEDGMYESFVGCAAMINYQDFGDKIDVYWYDRTGDVNLMILFKSEDKNYFGQFDISFPLDCLEKIEQSPEILSLFVPIHGKINRESDGEESFFNFKYIDDILKKNEIFL